MNTINEDATAVRCPLSAALPRKIRDLSKAFILEQLEAYYQSRPDPKIVESDYSLWQCTETRLQFAWPMLPGNSAFYEWVSHFESYYPGLRWEYGKVLELLSAGGWLGGKSTQVMDVGCGRGDFLRMLDSIPGERRVALDLNEPAIRACREQGFRAFCGTVETALAAGFLKSRDFPVVTSFHCLEHVARPVEFVRALMSVTAPGGRVFLSTPYSPMSFESDWFDIMNHPPHHMTRWNLDAYNHLAKMLAAKIRFFFPPSSDARRTLNLFRLLQYGPHRRVSKAKFLGDLLRLLPVVFRHYRLQQARRRTGPGGGADLVLVELTVS